MDFTNVMGLRFAREDALALECAFKFILERLSNSSIDAAAKQEYLEKLMTFINLGHEVVKLTGSINSNLYQKHFSSFLRFCCFEQRDNKLYAPPITEMVQALFEMLSITVNCYTKSKRNVDRSNYIDFVQAFKKLISSEVIHNADLDKVSARLCKLMLADDKG